MKEVKMPGFDEWNALVEKYENKDLDNLSTREELLKDFELLSTDYWLGILENSNYESVAKSLAEIWCSDINYDSEKEAAREALYYMSYASDRMNFNRWLRIRILLNYSIK